MINSRTYYINNYTNRFLGMLAAVKFISLLLIVSKSVKEYHIKNDVEIVLKLQDYKGVVFGHTFIIKASVLY